MFFSFDALFIACVIFFLVGFSVGAIIVVHINNLIKRNPKNLSGELYLVDYQNGEKPSLLLDLDAEPNKILKEGVAHFKVVKISVDGENKQKE